MSVPVIDRAALEALPPDKRPEADALVAKLAVFYERNPLLRYDPHLKQRYFHRSTKRIKSFFGGNRSGKTTAGIADDLIQAVDRDCLPDHLKPYKKWEPPFKCRIVSPDFTSTMEGVIFEKLKDMAPKDQLLGGSWEKAYDKQRRKLSFSNGSWFDFLTSEQDVDKFSGAALHRVHFDEEPPDEKGRQIYRECTMRLVDFNGDMLFTMTPLLGLSWVYDVVWERRGPEVKKGLFENDRLTVVTVDIDENPHLSPEGKAAALEDKSPQELKAIKEGRFVHFAGLVYDEFDPDKHVIERVPRESLEGQTIFVTIDPGIKTTAILFLAFDGENNLVVFDEITLGESSAIPEVAAQAIKAKEEEWGVKPTYYVIDPAARHRSLVNAEQVSTAYMRAGINTVPGQNAVEPGIFEVKRRFDRSLRKTGTGEIRISQRCQKLLWEFTRYRMDPKAEGFAVVKQHDHHLDALRYGCMARPVAPHTLPKPRSHQTHWVPGTAPPMTYQVNEQPIPPFGD